jgi:hypothetical protein
MRKLLSPKRIRLALRGVKGVRAGGGPRRIRLLNVAEPKGLIVSTAEVVMEVEALDGTVQRIETVVPIPFFYSWGYRIGRKLHVPVLRSFDPQSLRFDVKVPRRRRSASASSA